MSSFSDSKQTLSVSKQGSRTTARTRQTELTIQQSEKLFNTNDTVAEQRKILAINGLTIVLKTDCFSQQTFFSLLPNITQRSLPGIAAASTQSQRTALNN